jgi:hypothetical protein
MRYEDVNSTQELNQKVADYVAFGYKIENRTLKDASLVKNDFSFIRSFTYNHGEYCILF